MPDFLTVLNTLANGAKLAAVAHQAGKGDQAALGHLIENWHEVLDLAQPGLGMTARQVLTASRDAYLNIQSAASGNVVEGEYRVLNERMPWGGFAKWLPRQTWGSFVILGPRGQGKSWLAMRLGQIWHEAHGYQVEAVNMYGEDLALLPYAKTIGMTELGNRMRRLRALLEGKRPRRRKTEDIELDEEPETIKDVERLPFLRRVIIIDEMSMAIGSHGMDAGRRLVRQAMAQSRHLKWNIVYIGQYTRQLPLDLFLNQCVFVKQPDGREPMFDRQEPWIQDLWQRAGDAFDEIKGSEYWHLNPKAQAWAYVHAEDIGGRRFQGMCPVSPPVIAEDEE